MSSSSIYCRVLHHQHSTALHSTAQHITSESPRTTPQGKFVPICVRQRTHADRYNLFTILRHRKQSPAQHNSLPQSRKAQPPRRACDIASEQYGIRENNVLLIILQPAVLSKKRKKTYLHVLQYDCSHLAGAIFFCFPLMLVSQNDTTLLFVIALCLCLSCLFPAHTCICAPCV